MSLVKRNRNQTNTNPAQESKMCRKHHFQIPLAKARHYVQLVNDCARCCGKYQDAYEDVSDLSVITL